MYLDHYDTEPIDFDLYSNNEDVSLDDEVVKFWNEVRNLEPHFDRSHYWFILPSIDDVDEDDTF